MGGGAIPLVGARQTRGWLQFKYELRHDTESRVNPDRTMHLATGAWVLRILAIRSDGLKCGTDVVLAVDEKTKEPTPVHINQALFEGGKYMQSFLNCECSARGPCVLHNQQNATGKPS